MSLRVGIDATGWSNRRGDGRFVRNAAARLIALYPEFEWSLYIDAATAGALDGHLDATIRPVRQGIRPTEALATGSGRRIADLARLVRAVRRRDLDVFLSPTVYSYYPSFGVPSVVGLHDATASTHTELVLPTRLDRALWRAKQGLALRLARRLFTVSAASRAAISANLGVPDSAIEVVPEAADPAFAPQPRASVDSVLADLGLAPEHGYLIFASGLSPHKGLATLVDAYARLREPRPELVVVGSTESEYPNISRVIEERIRALDLERTVHFTGFVSDHQLACLYSGALAAVVPSLTEGFGLAAVEAAACRTAVVLSDIPAHRETLGEAALLFRPGDHMELHDRLKALIAGSHSAEALGERARAVASRYSWDETARRLRALIADAAERG